MLFINFLNWCLNAGIFMVISRLIQMLFPESKAALNLGVIH